MTLILLAALTLTGCANTIDLNTEGVVGGVATYDAVQRATAECTAKGGHIVISQGGDPTMMDNYSCRRNRAGAAQ